MNNLDWLESYDTLIDSGMSQRKACKELGLSRKKVYRELLKLKCEPCEDVSYSGTPIIEIVGGWQRFFKPFKAGVNGLSILVISDCQIKPKIDTSFVEAIGKYISAKQPDIIVNIGDWWDMASLSSFDKGKLSFEGRRLQEDIDSGNAAMDKLTSLIFSIKGYHPRMIFCLGNHEQRLKRIPRDNPEFEGFVGYHLLNLKDWEVHDFLKPVEVNGIWFSHYLQNPHTGKPLGGSALNQLKTVGNSFVVGHKQVLDVAIRPVLSGGLQLGIICGAAYMHKEDYLGYTGNNHFRGITMLYNVKNGFGNPSFIDTQYLLDNYLEQL